MADQRLPTLEQTLGALLESWQGRVYTTLPGVVESYSAATRTATVSVGVKRKLLDGSLETIPPIQNVRVVLPECGTWEIDFDLTAGDEGLLHFSARSLEVWRQNGGIVDPRDTRKHDLSDAWFVPGGQSKPRTTAGVSQKMVLRAKDGSVAIELDNATNMVKVGDQTATDFGALASLVATQLTTLKTAISAAPVVAGDGGASFKAVLLAALSSWPGSVAATKVKLK